ncbi:MAG: glycoside hydrolase family 6 protein [Candidatus Saccharimonadaceae bacterium]
MRRRAAVTFRGTSTPPPPVQTPNPLAGKQFWVDPGNDSADYAASIRTSDPSRAAIIDKIALNAVVPWWYPTQSNAQTYISSRMDTIIADNAFPIFVLYQIPYRDVGAGLSGGGLSSRANYDQMIDGVAAGINNRECAIILEPDAVAEVDHLGQVQGTTARSDRVAMLSRAITVLTAAGAYVYLDGGNPGFPTGTGNSVQSFGSDPADVAALLDECGLAGARGFSLNVSNFYDNSQIRSYGNSIVTALNTRGLSNKKYIIDTSRNGNGRGDTWCNPAGRALGVRPTASTSTLNCDAYLWIKTPGRSDGDADYCGAGAPPAGTYWPDYAYELASNAAW